MYRGIVLFSTLFFLLAPIGFAETWSVNGLVEKQREQLDTQKIEKYWQELMDEYGGFFPEMTVPNILQLVLSNNEFSISYFLKGFLKFMFYELIINLKLLGAIVVLTVFSMILETIQTAFEKNTVSKVAYAISYMVLIIIAINSFYLAVNYARDAIQGMNDFMLAIIPLVLALLASMGNFVSVSLFHPLIILMVNISGTLIVNIVFPLLFFSAVISIVSTFSEKYQVSQLAKLTRNIGIGILGIFLTVFLTIVSVQGASAAATDGITIRAAKFITGNFVPVVGRMFSDATDTVVGASLLIKNAVGISGVVILLFLAAFPAIKILSLALIYNFSAAVMQPLGNSPIIECLETIGKNLIYVFAALATVGLMFFLAITIMITAGNISVMIR
ncbi:stage III sporulation protein AE [Microaerobacter geothermalis]|uniref:stage III sporulation protein AE n=1 Tax=Microaerobacter geothermalis TaxID=674972 RepID=UPI001F1663BD|nr:stage III sporulation protein AE [Microaerobacter geothermalis]MCF6094453.1 stage III sporulation protein AE [Microaerobacter geothermalis]